MGRIGKMKPRKEIRRCGMDGGEVGRCAGDTIPHGKLKLHAHAPHAWTTQRSEKTPVKRGGESLLVWHGGYPINCIPETSQFLAQKQRNHGVGLHGGGNPHTRTDRRQTVPDIACGIPDQDEILSDPPLADFERTPPSCKSAR